MMQVSNGEPSDIITQFIKEKGHVYSDRQLASIIHQKYSTKISLNEIRSIRAKFGIYKLPPCLRPAFGGKEWDNHQDRNRFNKQQVIKVCKAILQYDGESDETFIHASKLYPSVSKGETIRGFAYLNKMGIAIPYSKGGHSKIWKVNIKKLKEELKKLKK